MGTLLNDAEAAPPPEDTDALRREVSGLAEMSNEGDGVAAKDMQSAQDGVENAVSEHSPTAVTPAEANVQTTSSSSNSSSSGSRGCTSSWCCKSYEVLDPSHENYPTVLSEEELAGLDEVTLTHFGTFTYELSNLFSVTCFSLSEASSHDSMTSRLGRCKQKRWLGITNALT